MNWISVKDSLPPINLVVLIAYENYVCFGARVDDDEGWMWATCYDRLIKMDRVHDAVWHDAYADDEYPVTHWAFVTSPSKEEGQ